MGLIEKNDKWSLSDQLWELMKPLIPPGKPHRFKGHNPPMDRRAAMNAILFVLRTGCQWKALDGTGLGRGSTVHGWFVRWVKEGVFHEFWRSGLLACEALEGIKWDWCSADGSMTKAPLGGEKSGPNPTDRAKKGVKRSVMTDGNGVPIGIAVGGANMVDFKMLAETIGSIPVERPVPTSEEPQNMCLDKGYDYKEARKVVADNNFTPHIRSRGEEKRSIKEEPGYKARRWVVERVFSWINRFRRLLVRWEKKEETYTGMLQFVCGIIAYRGAKLLSSNT